MDELIARTLPHSLEAEQSVLGSMLIDNRCVADVIDILKPEDFYLKQNQDIFETLYLMFSFSEVIDPVTVLNKMEERGLADNRTSGYLMQLMEVTPTAAYAVKYANIVKEKSLLRALAEASDDIANTVYEGVGTADDILEHAEQKIYGIRKGNTGDTLQKIGTVLVDVYSRLSELASSDQAFPGLSTGLVDLDRKINGLNKSDLIIIAARPGMGKTSLALNMALNVAKKTDKTVALFNLEMSKEQLAMRLISNESFVDNQKLMTGKLSEEEWVKIGTASAALSKTDIRIDDNPAITVAAINAKCRRLENLGLIIIDYLQLMTNSGYGGNKGDNRVNVVSDISRSLKIMAKELNVPVICLSQLSRSSEKRGDDKRPMMSDLRESGAIEQDADCILFIYRDDYYNDNSEEKNVAEIIVSKNRHGETGTVKLQWIPEFTTFSDREWIHEE
ncbi:MAG: replicative DNA helicase [Oscillospiraceae bacterium]|nr:replicative DNA helicase [Oscillospiraceae bacterium]